MKANKVLIITAIAGLFFSGCAEFQLPKVQKQKHELSDEECEIILKKYRNTEPSTSDAYNKLKYDAYECNTRYKSPIVIPDFEK